MTSKAIDVEIITAMIKTKYSVALIGIWVFSFAGSFMFYPHSSMQTLKTKQKLRWE
ncbi:MAG: hypothetical protein U1D41_00690 [Nitrosomonas sp.]|uniref:hypothetical protein n=1 Tax=Nitrosomonas sp. TaxID=42353 RepID=UPI0027314781|nr:hypothetical protein [Nitrosomonas sp.]MDP1786294.1 hypothetical protein [Nitrosomonas sp.]MDP2223651.1 hypothetical protein [Nitrosomonas sp.]MDP3663569.1 hypothetical protein [Nitrosomonas sp.]MDZ4104684.1 hypothetical protein [Nitrosomonas sp.]